MAEEGEEGNGGVPASPTGGSHSAIELIRIQDRTTHVSPMDRQRETDYTVRNVSDSDVNYIFLPLREFKLNLEIKSEKGKKLNYFPNSEVEGWIDEQKDKNPELYKQLKHRFKHAEYKIYIQLSEPINPGELRTVTLTFEQSETVSFYSITDPKLHRGWISQWKKKLFKIPSFIDNADRYPGHGHDEFVVAVGPPGYGTKGSIEHDVKDKSVEEDFYENGLDEETRVFSARLPPAKSKPYSWELQYDLIPNNARLMKSLAAYWFGAIIIGFVSLFAASSGKIDFLTPYGKALSATLATTTLGLIFALDMEWAEKYRILSVLPIFLHVLSWVMWELSLPIRI